jgi:hypothetical protein
MMVPDEPQEQEEAVEAPEIHPDQESLEVPGPPVTVAEGEAEALPEADEYKPQGEELVVSQDRTVFEVMDAHDIEQMIDSMQGRLLDVSLYDFESGGQRMVELSWKGVRECVHAMHETGKCRIGIQPETLQTSTVVDEGETWYEAAVFAKDEYSGLGFFGFAREPKMMKRRDKPPTLDKFAKTKAINKAQRNALRMFVPEKLAQTLIAQFRKDENRIKKLRGGGPMVGAVAELPPVVDTDEGKALIREIDGLWDAIRATDGFAATMTPAHFFAYKTRAEAQNPDDPEDVSRLEQFRDTLVQTLEIVRKKAEAVDA